MSPFIYTAVILYPFLFGYGLFRKKQPSCNEKYIVFLDFNRTNDSTNVYYKNNIFSLKTEIDFELDYEETEQLDLFNESEVPYETVFSYMTEFKTFWDRIAKKYNYTDHLYFVVSSNVFTFFSEELFEESDHIHLVDMVDSYGIIHNYESDIPLMNDEKKKEKTYSKFLYNKVLNAYESFPDCYVK